MHVLPREKQVRTIAALTEGMSIRATERLVDVHRDTVASLGLRVGEGCTRLLDAMMRDLHVGVLELDEQWQFIGKKQKRVTEDDSEEMGDTWLWVALDATSKAVVAFVVGKRSSEQALELALQLRGRILNRPQVTADGFPAYPAALDYAFGTELDFAQVVKTFAAAPGNDAAHRYSPGRVIGVETNVVCGSPDPNKISTSFVERFNLTTRMQQRRFTRLSNGFSKRLRPHAAAVGLHMGWYNLCRVHETTRVTPAMALRVTDHIWTIGELVDAALGAPVPPPLPRPGQQSFAGMSAARAKKGDSSGSDMRRPRLTVLKGGRK